MKIGDAVEFDLAGRIKTGVVKNIKSNILSIYCVDSTGGYTMLVPVENVRGYKMSEEIKNPKRYNKRGKLECWDVILDQEMDFLEGSVLKYLWRYKEKNGIHDLEKAKVYIDKIISEFKKNETN